MMEVEKFHAILPLIVAAVTDKIVEEYNLNEDEAIEKFYSSRIYSYLEDEKTKVWHYSAYKIFDLFKTDFETGILDLPDY
jgi:hypothetical protein